MRNRWSWHPWSSRRALVAVAILCAVGGVHPAPALQSFRNLGHRPLSDARPSDVITITFDRPVVRMLEGSVDPARFVRVEPDVHARVEWRDASTIRVIPGEPLQPGRRYTVVVDSGLTASDGGRLAVTERIVISVRGPEFATSEPRVLPNYDNWLPVSGHLMLVYSAPVPDSVFDRLVRLEISASGECQTPRTIAYRVIRQRPMEPTDPWHFRYGRDYTYVDSLALRFRRVVELDPVERPPEGCTGRLVIPTFDSLDTPTAGYGVRTALPFVLEDFVCADPADCAAAGSFILRFSSPITRDAFTRSVHFSPAEAFGLKSEQQDGTTWVVSARFVPLMTYAFRVDSTLRDVFDRPVGHPGEHAIVVGNRMPDFGFGRGFITLGNAAPPLLRVRHVNVDSLTLRLMPVPDSEAVHQAAGWPQWWPDEKRWMPRDTVVRVVALHAPFNEERVTAIPVPELGGRFRGRLVVVEAAVGRASTRDNRNASASSRPALPAGSLGAAAQRLPALLIDVDYLNASPRAVVQTTDLMAHARLTRRGGAVWVTSVRTGAPVRGARVRMLDSAGIALAESTTDAQGLATLMAAGALAGGPALDTRTSMVDRPSLRDERRARLFVEVTRGDDRSLALLSSSGDMGWYEAYDAYEFDRAWPVSSAEEYAAVFTERGIYRPTEVVYTTAIVREGPLGALRAPAPGDSVRWTIESSAYPVERRTLVSDTIVPLATFGTTTTRAQIGAGVPLGEYRASVSMMRDGAWREAGFATFKVGEYRAPEFLVSLNVDSAPRLRGDTIRADVGARFLFDAPMRGATASWRAHFAELDAWDLRIPGLPAGYVVGDQARWWERDTVERSHHSGGSMSLSDAGRGALAIATDSANFSRGALVTINVSVTDVNRQEVAAPTIRTVVHPADLYVALRDAGKEYFWLKGTPRAILVKAVGVDGRTLRGVRVRIATVEQRWSVAKTGSGEVRTGGWHADTVAVDSVTTADSAVTLSVLPARSGPIVLVATAVDSHGRTARTTTGHYVSGASWLASSSKQQLPVVAVRDRLVAGDQAVITFVSPFARADAWVTLEREGILSHRLVRGVHGPVTVRLAMTEADAPNVYANVMLVRQGDATTVDSLEQRYRAGQVMLRVDAAPKRLDVQVQSERSSYLPADSATFTVRVRDRTVGVPAVVTLWAVDEGVLALTGYATPDPVDLLYRLTTDGLRFATTLSTLAPRRPPFGWRGPRFGQRLALASAAFSVSAAANGPINFSVVSAAALRTDFRTTAFFLGGVVTDAQGSAEVRVKLPDNLTTFRVIAVAAGQGDRYGSAAVPMVVTKPLLIRAALPRFVRAGDSLRAGGVVNARDGAARAIEVSASGTGIELLERGEANAALAPAGTEVRFSWRGIEGDTARIRLSVTDGLLSDALLASIPVRPDREARVHTLSGLVRDSAVVRFRLPAGVDVAKSRLTLRAGTVPAPAIRVARAFVTAYPYDCSEQLASVGHVLLSLLDLSRSGIRALDDTTASRLLLQRIADQLVARQRTDGAIGMWGRWWWSVGWLSSYAGLFLLDARDAGVRVDADNLSRLERYLAGTIDSVHFMPDTSEGMRLDRARRVANHLSDRLAAATYLARMGHPHGDEHARLLADARRLTWEDRVSLAALLGRSGDSTDARTLLDRAWAALGVAGNRVDMPDSVLVTTGFPSRVRPAARLLTATLALEPGHPRLGALIERLVTRVRAEDDWWWNTQDHASAAVALSVFARTQKASDARLSASVGGADLADRRPAISVQVHDGVARDSTIGLAGAPRRVAGTDSVEVEVRLRAPDGPVFFALSLDEMPLARPVSQEARGITVERWYERFDDGRTVTEVAAGELVRVRMRVTVPSDREFVAVADPLPAGLEAVDASLLTVDAHIPASADAAAGRRRDVEAGGDQNTWWSPWEHSEMRDDRVVFFARTLWSGSFTLSYVARATTAGRFVRPQAHAEEMYNPAVAGRSDGGWFVVREQEKRP